jgi:hypothetical protein
VRWPEGFNFRFTSTPQEMFAHWIDTDMKEATQAARSAGTTFEPVIEIYDQYQGLQ